MNNFWVFAEDWSGEIFEAVGLDGAFFGMLRYRRPGQNGATLVTFHRQKDMEQFMDFLDFDNDEDTNHDLE